MSIFQKPLQSITWSDLEELLTEKARENIRLDFKSQTLGTDKMLKMVSSFANTYGGHLVIGATESNGVIDGLPGTTEEPNFDQQLTQICAGLLSPPLQPLVSPPIRSPLDLQKVCYVVRVEMSDLAPHFIERRKGFYVRTNDHSSQFEPKLGSYEELQHLQHRRQHLVSKREQMVAQFDRVSIELLNSWPGELAGAAILSISPSYPSSLVNEVELADVVGASRLRIGHFGEYPQLPLRLQHESVFRIDPHQEELFIATVHGMMHYTFLFSRTSTDGGIELVPSDLLLESRQRFLHAGLVLQELGAIQPLQVRLRLLGIRGHRVSVHYGRQIADALGVHLQPEVSLRLATSVDELIEPRELVTQLGRLAFPVFGSNAMEMEAHRTQLVQGAFTERMEPL